MFAWLRNRLLSLIDRAVAEQRTELARQRDRIVHFEHRTSSLMERADGLKENRDTLLRLIDAILKGIGFDGEINAQWKETPATALHAVRAHVDNRLSALELRASKAERDAEDLRVALSDERQQHEQTRGALRAAEAENASVWAVIERDRTRIAAETAIANRRKAAAETDAKRRPEDDE